MNEAATPAAPVSTRRRWLPLVPTKKVAQYSGARWVVGTAGAALSALLAILAQRYVVLRGADTDLFPRWYGLRALLFEGRDPYGAAVTAQIAAQTSLADAPQIAQAAYGFVYALPGALLMAPLALARYEWASALWLTLGLVALPSGTVLAVRALNGRSDRTAELFAMALSVVFLPAVWNLALVQPGLVVVPLMALALWLWRRRPFWAGVALSCAALLKPQMAAPLAGAWGLASALAWRQPSARRLVAGQIAVAVALCGLAALLLPTWLGSWLGALRVYSRVPEMEPLLPAIYHLTRGAVEDGSARLATAAVSVALAVWAVRGWRADAGSPEALPMRGIARTIVAGALLMPPARETNALVLLIPLAGALAGLSGRARLWLLGGSVSLSVALAPLALLFPWRSGAMTIAAYVALWAVFSWWAARAPPGPRAADRAAAAAGAG